MIAKAYAELVCCYHLWWSRHFMVLWRHNSLEYMNFLMGQILCVSFLQSN